MDINAILSTIGQHNWLALVVLGAIYLRKLVSDASAFPVTLPVNVRPLVMGAATAVVVAATAREAGQAWGAAALSAGIGLVAGGFADGLLVACFGSPAAAPTWAKAVCFLVDDIFGGKGGAGGSKLPMQPPANDAPRPPSAARVALAWVLDIVAPAHAVTRSTSTHLRVVGTSRVHGFFRRAPLFLASAFAIGACTPAGGPTPQAVGAVDAGFTMASCMFSVYGNDMAQVPAPSWETIALDEAKTCGPDAAQFVVFFGAKHPITVAHQSLLAAGKVAK